MSASPIEGRRRMELPTSSTCSTDGNSVAISILQITLQIHNPDTPDTPPTPVSPRESISPDGLTLNSSGSSNTAVSMSGVSKYTFLAIGSKYTKTKSKESEITRQRRFKSFFGVTPHVCFLVWQKIKIDAPPGSEPKHLLWCLNFLKQYTDEHTRKAVLGAVEKTIRKWTWIFVKLVSDLNVIIWDNRYDESVRGQTCFVSLDGVDFEILEPIPFDHLWFSHKFCGPGLRYEVGLNIRTGHIVWAFGGYPCGQYSDLVLAREAFVFSMNRNERAMAVKGYADATCFILPSSQNNIKHKHIMSRHETVNKRLRQFLILKAVYRHDRQKHPMVFQAVANLTQLMIGNGSPLFNVI